MAKIASVTAEPQPKGKKVLAHLEIHPRMGGGHMVKHVYGGFHHEPKEVAFKDSEGHKALNHIAKHAGLPPVAAEGSMHENATDINDEESQEGE